MATQQPDKLPAQGNRRKKLFQRMLVIATVIIIAIAITIIWILSSLNIISRSWATISSIIITVLGVVFAFLQSLHLFFPPDKHESSVALEPSPFQQIPSTFVQPTHRGIVGLPPPTDPRTILQRQNVVEEVYTKLTQPGITAIALTGIGGVGKSTLAALLYNYTKEQHHAQKGSFLAEALWLTVDPAVTFADLAGTLFEALGKPLPDLGNLAPQNQAVALFNALNTTDKPRLVILDQFENLLDWETGHALTDRPGVGEWLDIINSKQCTCRILLTSRPRPVGTREFPSTYMQEYPVRGLEVAEAMELLQNQGVKGTDEELKNAVVRCAGHAFSLTLLASLIRDHSISLTALFKDPTLWTGDIATNLLDQIYTLRLSDVQRKLLLAFSAYREPVLLDAAQTVIIDIPKAQVPPALKALRTQHLLEAVGEGRYQLHTIIAGYAQTHFDETNEQANEEALRSAHAKAAQYYLQQAAKSCPPREQRRQSIDIHDLIEAIWQKCQAGMWQEADNLMQQEDIFSSLNLWGGNEILLELYQLLLPLSKWNPERSQAARIYNNLGWITSELGQKEHAQKYFEEALRICKESGDQREKGMTLNNLGWIFSELGQMERAQEYLEQALDICREVGDRRWEGWTLNNLGKVYEDIGHKERALEYLEQALRIRKELGNRLGESRTLKNLGGVYSALGKKKEALKCLEEALRINKEVGDRGGEGLTLNKLGLFYCNEVGDWEGEGMALNKLGSSYNTLEQKEQALECYTQALSIHREVGNLLVEGMTLNNLGLFYANMGEKEQARNYYEDALKIFKEVGGCGQEATTLHNIGVLYFEQHQYDSALACFLHAKELFEVIHSPDSDLTKSHIERLQKEVGDEQFTVLLAQVKPQAQQIVDQALHAEME